MKKSNGMLVSVATLKLFVVAIILTSCGRFEGDLSSISSLQANERPIIFALGGNASCKRSPVTRRRGAEGSDTYHKLMEMLGDLNVERGQEPEYLVACFTKSAKVMSYITSWNQNIVYEGSIASVRREIKNKRKNLDNNKSILVGHSYGGWLGMSIVNNLTQDQGFEHFYSVDPISKKLCSFATPEGCLQAPEDLTGTMRQKIAENTTNWENYYQTRTSYLHSSSIPQADQNDHLFVSHFEIDTHDQVWNSIKSRMNAFID